MGRASGDQNRPGAAESKPELWRVSVDGEVADAEAAERDKLTSGESKAVVNAIRIVRTEEASGCIKLSELSDTQQHKLWRNPIDHQRRVGCHGCGGGNVRPVNISEASQACDATEVGVYDVGDVDDGFTADLEPARGMGTIRDDSRAEERKHWRL